MKPLADAHLDDGLRDDDFGCCGHDEQGMRKYGRVYGAACEAKRGGRAESCGW